LARPKHPATKRPLRRIRVRSRPLAEIDEAKLATALALMARRLVEQLAAEATSKAASADRRDSEPEVA
jgi:hypothetical protein